MERKISDNPEVHDKVKGKGKGKEKAGEPGPSSDVSSQRQAQHTQQQQPHQDTAAEEEATAAAAAEDEGLEILPPCPVNKTPHSLHHPIPHLTPRREGKRETQKSDDIPIILLLHLPETQLNLAKGTA